MQTYTHQDIRDAGHDSSPVPVEVERFVALPDLVSVLRAMFEPLCDGAGHFTCGEANRVADLLSLADDAAVALGADFLMAHARHDEEGDEHWQGGEA